MLKSLIVKITAVVALNVAMLFAGPVGQFSSKTSIGAEHTYHLKTPLQVYGGRLQQKAEGKSDSESSLPTVCWQRSATESLIAVSGRNYNYSNITSSALPSSAPTQSELREVYEKSRSALRFLDKFWGSVFSLNGRRLVPPRVEVIDRDENIAYYSSSDRTIRFSPAFFVRQMRKAAAETKTDGDMAFIVILAHEYGHAVQHQLGQLRGYCPKEELQADALAGAFTMAARDARFLDPGDIDEATYSFYEAGDLTGHRSDCPHGSKSQRVRAFHAGIEEGYKAAGLTW